MLVKAFSMIASKCPQWYIDIYGSGDEKAMLCQLIADYNLQGRIVIHEPTTDIYREYQTSDFLVLSSRYEGFALVLLEAMACGIPCVAFRCKYGPGDVIHHGSDGLLANNGDIHALADGVLWMATHTEERLRMGKAARLTIENYRKEKIMNEWLDLFSHLKE